MLWNKELIKEIASEGRYTFVSTGMSSLEEIDEVVQIFRDQDCPFELMHTVSEYPLKQEDANLRCIDLLKKRYGCKVGYSGHESCLIKVSILAICIGATSIERHITLDRTMYGSDQAASIEARGLRDFVSTMRSVSGILGTGEKHITDGEWQTRKKLRSFEH